MKKLFLLMLIFTICSYAIFSRTNGVVLDSRTGLQWQDDYGDNGGLIKEASWGDSVEYCKDLILNDKNDWRLPNIKELRSIVDYTRAKPAINISYFFNTAYGISDDWYWSSTTVPESKTYAFNVKFRIGETDRTGKYSLYTYNVRCVRGGHIVYEPQKLTSGIPIFESVENKKFRYYKISAKEGQSITTILSNLSADIDLFVKVGSKPTLASYDCVSDTTSTVSESCAITLNSTQDVYIGVYGVESGIYTLNSIVAGGTDNILSSNVTVSGVVKEGEYSYYKIYAKSNQMVTALLDNLSADLDLYVKVGSKPTTGTYDCASYRSNTRGENCSISLNRNAYVYIGIFGFDFDSSTYNLKAIVQTDTDGDKIPDSRDTDDDNDGIPDSLEQANGLNPLNASDAQADFDNDGFANAIEISMGTNIRNASSKPIWIPIIMDDLMMFIPAKP